MSHDRKVCLSFEGSSSRRSETKQGVKSTGMLGTGKTEVPGEAGASNYTEEMRNRHYGGGRSEGITTDHAPASLTLNYLSCDACSDHPSLHPNKTPFLFHHPCAGTVLKALSLRAFLAY